jgi:DnaJ-class molecular chaperone
MKKAILFTSWVFVSLFSFVFFNDEHPKENNSIKINTDQFGIINPSKQYILKNRGLPILNTTKKGNMIIEFIITYPKINSAEIEKLTEILNKSFIY